MLLIRGSTLLTPAHLAMPRQVSCTTVRILIILSGFLVTSQVLLLFCQCKCKILGDSSQLAEHGRLGRSRDVVHDCSQVVNASQDGIEIEKYRNRIEELQKRVAQFERLDKVLISQDINQLKRQGHDETLHSYTPRNEYDVIPFDSFTLTAVYGDIGSLSKNPAELTSGRRGHEQNEVIRFAVNAFKEDVESKSDPVLPIHLAEGVTRNDRLFGTVYELHFRSEIPDVFKRIKVIRPFGSLEKIGKTETIDTSKEVINVIVPLAGRLDKFEEFMKRFVDVGIRSDRKVFLTVIFYGMEGRDRMRQILQTISKEEKFTHYKVIFTNQEFSRGAALQKGAESWNGGNVILFFCDVDIYFSTDFLERCRLYTIPRKRVYYPIVYSQYNPIIVYGGQTIPPLQQQMKLNKDSGFWRDFGFGMTCQYRDDFFQIGGFDLTIKGWGMEDVKLYRKYLHSDMAVIRAYDRNIFHIYHEKKCSKSLTDDQFISCLQSKAVSEGSHKQMGMLAFGKYLLGNAQPDWRKLLEASLSGAVEKGAAEDVKSDVSNNAGDRHFQNADTKQSNIEDKKRKGLDVAMQAKLTTKTFMALEKKETKSNAPDVAMDKVLFVNSENKEKSLKADEQQLKFADDIMTHAQELEMLYNDIYSKLKEHPNINQFENELHHMLLFQKKLKDAATTIFGASSTRKKDT